MSELNTVTTSFNNTALDNGKRTLIIEIELRQQKRHFLVQTRQGEIELTKRELDCLYYLLLGFSSKLAGRQMSISNRTVEKHIESIKNKLGCMTKAEIMYLVSHQIRYN